MNAGIHEADGSLLPVKNAAAALACGVVGLNIVGVTPVLLGALADAHRLSAADLGVAAMLELFGMGLTTGLAGALLKPKGLKRLAIVFSVLLAVVNALCVSATGPEILVLRTLAGVPEGGLIWIAVGMIARSKTPERWAAYFFMGQVAAQLALALLFWVFVLPRFGADGGFVVMAATTLLAAPAALLLPAAYGPLTQAAGLSGSPPARGWAALLATFVFVSANGAVTVYLEPLAHEAGLSADVARLALVASLIGQVAGGVLAIVLAGRVGYLKVFAVCTATYLAVWGVYGFTHSAAVFIIVTMAAGVINLLVGPFLTPMSIEVDPTRRTAMQSAGAQIFGGAAGPLVASRFVTDASVRLVLTMASVALAVGFAAILLLSLTAPRRSAAA